MDDLTLCPICRQKLRSLHTPGKQLPWIGKTANYIERLCSNGLNHTLQVFTDSDSGQIDLLKLSLNPRYSRFLEIDFVNEKCRLSCFKEGKVERLTIDRLLMPDFPSLSALKEKIRIYASLM
jgi:hypothetical protein